VQTCIVHLIRNSMDFASSNDRKAIAAALKTVYRAKDADAGRAENYSRSVSLSWLLVGNGLQGFKNWFDDRLKPIPEILPRLFDLRERCLHILNEVEKRLVHLEESGRHDRQD